MLGTIVLFWYAVRTYTGSGWLAFAFAAPLHYAGIWGIVARIQPDFLAAALALASVSFLLLLVTRPRAWLLWLALTLTVFADYQVRPGYLFMLALIPVVGVVLHLAHEQRHLIRSLRFGSGLLLAAALPFLSFCTLRWTLVGDFGLVSFGGYNAIGITASLLDQELVDGLSRNRNLAERILRDREQLGWSPMPLRGDAGAWHQQYNTNVWRIGVVRAAEALAEDGTPEASTLGVNRLLKELSHDIIRQKPLHYAKWVGSTLTRSLALTAAEPGIRWPALLVALSLALGIVLGAVSPARSAGAATRRRDRVLGLVTLGLTFTVAHAAILALVSVPYYPRYLYALLLLLPPVLCGVLFETWRSIVAGLEQRGIPVSVIGLAVASVAALVLVPSAVSLYRGVVTRTTALAVSSWLRDNAAPLAHKTIASEVPLAFAPRRAEEGSPLVLQVEQLSELSPTSLDLSDYEVFPGSKLEGMDRELYAQRVERLDAANVGTVEPRLFRRVGPPLVVLSHPWRILGSRGHTGPPTLNPVPWRRRTNLRLGTTLPAHYRTGQVISLDAALTWEQARDCELTLGGEKLRLHLYLRTQLRLHFMSPRILLADGQRALRFACPDPVQMSPEPALAAIRWLPGDSYRAQ